MQGFRAYVLRYRLLPKYDFEDMQQDARQHSCSDCREADSNLVLQHMNIEYTDHVAV